MPPPPETKSWGPSLLPKKTGQGGSEAPGSEKENSPSLVPAVSQVFHGGSGCRVGAGVCGGESVSRGLTEARAGTGSEFWHSLSSPVRPSPPPGLSFPIRRAGRRAFWAPSGSDVLRSVASQHPKWGDYSRSCGPISQMGKVRQGKCKWLDQGTEVSRAWPWNRPSGSPEESGESVAPCVHSFTHSPS